MISIDGIIMKRCFLLATTSIFISARYFLVTGRCVITIETQGDKIKVRLIGFDIDLCGTGFDYVSTTGHFILSIKKRYAKFYLLTKKCLTRLGTIHTALNDRREVDQQWPSTKLNI
jgi:hypothetical protein